MGSQRRIKITAGDVQVAAVLGPGATADLVWEALPIEASASTWGDEIYFRTSIEASEEPGVSDVVELGAVAFWPRGRRCACSSVRRPRAAAARSGRPAR